MLDKRLTDVLTDCKASLATVEDEATKKNINNLTDKVTSVVHNVNREQQEREAKRRKDDSKQDYHKSAQLKTVEIFDDEDATTTIATCLDDIAYVCEPHIKEGQLFEAILCRLHARIQDEVRQINRKRRAESKHPVTHKDLIQYLLHTYKDDSDRDKLVEVFNKVKQDSTHVRNHNREYNAVYLFSFKKLQLGPINAAFQKLQYALKNSARAKKKFSNVFSSVFIVDLTAKFLKLYVQVVNSIHFI